MIAGKHAGRLRAVSYLGGYVTNDRRVQQALAEYLSCRSQDRNLRRIREQLAERMERGLQLLANNLSADCSVSRPTGGFTCWVRAPQRFVSSNIAPALHKHDVGILPGPFFSAARSFENFFALNLSFPWSADHEAKIAHIAATISGEVPA